MNYSFSNEPYTNLDPSSRTVDSAYSSVSWASGRCANTGRGREVVKKLFSFVPWLNTKGAVVTTPLLLITLVTSHACCWLQMSTGSGLSVIKKSHWQETVLGFFHSFSTVNFCFCFFFSFFFFFFCQRRTSPDGDRGTISQNIYEFLAKENTVYIFLRGWSPQIHTHIYCGRNVGINRRTHTLQEEKLNRKC